MSSEGLFGAILPVPGPDLIVPFRVQWIVDLIVGAFVLAHDQESNVLVCVVEHGVRNAGSGLEPNAVTRS